MSQIPTTTTEPIPTTTQTTSAAPAPNTSALEAKIAELEERLSKQPQVSEEHGVLRGKMDDYRNLRSSFMSAGYDAQTAEVLAVASLSGDVGDASGGDPPTGAGAPSHEDSNDDARGGVHPLELELANLRRGLTEVSNRQQQREYKALAKQFQDTVTSKFTSNEELRKVLESLPEDKRASARERLLRQIATETKTALQRRREQAQGAWDESWIAEEADKVTRSTAEWYRTVIPDPSRLGRAGETVAEAQAFLKKPPVAPPSYKPGMSLGDADKAVRDFALDQLLRGQAETAGTTKV